MHLHWVSDSFTLHQRYFSPEHYQQNQGLLSTTELLVPDFMLKNLKKNNLPGRFFCVFKTFTKILKPRHRIWLLLPGGHDFHALSSPTSATTLTFITILFYLFFYCELLPKPEGQAHQSVFPEYTLRLKCTCCHALTHSQAMSHTYTHRSESFLIIRLVNYEVMTFNDDIIH